MILKKAIRHLELRACRRPFAVLVSGNINGVVDQAHAVIRSLVFKCIPVFLAVVHNELYDLWRGVGYLDGIRLDVRHGKPAILYGVFQVYHAVQED